MRWCVFLLPMVVAGAAVPPSCDSAIYCHGDLLHAVQTAGIYHDSKTFVDMTMRREPAAIAADFRLLMIANGNNLTRQQVMTFVDSNFESDLELVDWLPADYNPSPSFLNDIPDTEIREFAAEIVAIWPKLTRKVSPSVAEHPTRHSIIHLPNGIVVPGGRFRESYYWDTYWIIKGLLASEMHATVRGLLDNFVHLIKIYGFIPNGGRVYYARRSQPPLFASMCMEYFKVTGNISWVGSNIAYLEQEVRFWDARKIQIGKHKVARYLPISSGPRPESYKEDYRVALEVPPGERQRVYEDLKGAAESGWDFSSRWFHDGAVRNLSQIHTRRTIPVDLNAYLARSYFNLAHFHSVLGNTAKKDYWYSEFLKMKVAIRDIFWNAGDGMWYDFDVTDGRHRREFYASNLVPLWACVEHDADARNVAFSYLEKNGILAYPGGTPASIHHTGEQWDFPNAWAPLQDIIITALNRGDENTRAAKYMAYLWITANAIGLRQTGEMFEKYDALVPGKYGGGGEYTVQAGFGWTNGLALDLIKTYFTRTN